MKRITSLVFIWTTIHGLMTDRTNVSPTEFLIHLSFLPENLTDSPTVISCFLMSINQLCTND